LGEESDAGSWPVKETTAFYYRSVPTLKNSSLNLASGAILALFNEKGSPFKAGLAINSG
jgi:hypothetical protein